MQAIQTLIPGSPFDICPSCGRSAFRFKLLPKVSDVPMWPLGRSVPRKPAGNAQFLHIVMKGGSLLDRLSCRPIDAWLSINAYIYQQHQCLRHYTANSRRQSCLLTHGTAKSTLTKPTVPKPIGAEATCHGPELPKSNPAKTVSFLLTSRQHCTRSEGGSTT